jgi:hypothetical protein
MFEDSSFNWAAMKYNLGEDAFEILKQQNPEMIPLDNESIEELKRTLGEKWYSDLYYPKSEEEYKKKFLDNMHVCHRKLEGLKTPITSKQLLEIHALMNSGITKTNQYDCGRSAPFLFLPDGYNNMAMTEEHVLRELALMDLQVDELYDNAESIKDKIRAALFQGLRWVAIHPANDGNKRMMKMILNQLLADLGLIPDIDKKWDDVSTEVFKQAIHGNNLSGFLKAAEEIYDIDLDVQEYEIAPFNIMPSTDENAKLSLDDTRLHSEKKCLKEPTYKRFTADFLSPIRKSVGLLNFKARKTIDELSKKPLSSEEALKLVNKLEGAIEDLDLKNLRYIVGVSESGFKPYLDKTMSTGKLDNEIKSKSVRPVVISRGNDPPNKEDLAKIVAESTVALEIEQTQVRTLNQTRQNSRNIADEQGRKL